MVTKVNTHVVIEEDESHIEVVNEENGKIELKMKLKDLINGFDCGWKVIAEFEEEEEESKADSEN